MGDWGVGAGCGNCGYEIEPTSPSPGEFPNELVNQNAIKLSNGHSPQIRKNGELLVRMCRGQAIAFDILKVTKYKYKYLAQFSAEYRYFNFFKL
jgi:hypothetical protein